MLKKTFAFSLLFSLVLAQQVQLNQCQLFATPQNNIINVIVTDINLIGQGGYIGIESPYITNQDIRAALLQAIARGAQVRLAIDAQQLIQNPGMYAPLLAHIVPINGLHAKRILIAQHIPIPGQAIQGLIVTYLGSMNFTIHAPYNLEILARCRDPQIFTNNYNDQQLLLNNPNVYWQTHYLEPRDYPYPHFNLTIQRTLSSISRNAQQAKINLITTFPQCQNAGDSLYITAMTLDDPQIVEAIINAANNTEKPISVILDGSNENNDIRQNYIQQLLEAGVHVYLYNLDRIAAPDGHPMLFHMKIILRVCNNQCTAIISTGNLTLENQQTVNHDLLIPCSPAFSARLRNILDAVIADPNIEELELEDESNGNNHDDQDNIDNEESD
jgi:phosphatidylserine/phosphatidylglycerophosphate/cardiolipin synthase-like enzyme